MATLVTDAVLSEKLIKQRRATGADRWDEVWEGLYIMAPLPNDEHQQIVSRLTSILEEVVGWAGLGQVRPGVNVSDREDDWTTNYRCPDVALFLNETTAENRDTHWLGGPDFAVEIVSPQDRAREKIEFYANAGTREVLVIDRDPWALELYHREGAQLRLASRQTCDTSEIITSDVVPLSFRLTSGVRRATIQVTWTHGERSWNV